MSFASDVKEELARADLGAEAAPGRLCAMLQILSSITLSSSGLHLTVRCHSATTARTVAADILAVYGIHCQINVIKASENSRSRIYEVTVSEKAREILSDLDLWTERGLQSHPRMSFLKNDELIRAYIYNSRSPYHKINFA